MDNYGESNWPGRLAQLRKTKKTEKIVCVQFEEAAEHFQLAKKGKKVSWTRLDCQDELDRSMTCNKFTTLTLGEEEQEFDEVFTSVGGNCCCALYTAVQETGAKRKVHTKRNIDMLVKVRESPVAGCAKNSSYA